MNISRESEGGGALAHAVAPAPASAPDRPYGGVGSGEVVVIKKEEEETLGQLRDRQLRASAPGSRAVFVHIKVEDTDGEQGGGGEGDVATGGERDEAGEEVDKEEEKEKEEEEEEEEEEDDEQEAEDEEEADEGQQREQHTQAPSVSLEGRMEAVADAVSPPQRARLQPGSYADTTAVQLDTDDDYEEEDDEDDEDENEEEEEEKDPRDPRAMASGAIFTGGSEAVHPQRLMKGARSEPRSPLARLRAPGRVPDNDIQQHEEEDAGVAPALTMSVGGDHAGSSRFVGVSWKKDKHKWLTRYQGKHLGCHTTEEGAARPYSKNLKEGSVLGPAFSSLFKGVTWSKSSNKWLARYKGKYLGYHSTEEDATRAYNKFLKDSILPEPAERAEWCSSQFTGVS